MLVLFDLDDTLLDHKAASRAAALELHKNFGAKSPISDFLIAWESAQERHYARYYVGEISFEEQRRARLREVLDPTISDGAADTLFAQHFEVYERSWQLFADVLPCLDRLSAHKLGVITNGEGYLQRRKLEKAGIFDRFDCILISSECGYVKPDKEIFHTACKMGCTAPEDTIYVGDRYDIDAQAARNAGLRGVWLDRKAVSSPSSGDMPIIRSLDELVI